ncbi:hypothetical protein SLS62_005027 [Diatrype stigma]|uniref:Uncharacterized protein n=1 Tax=Diatrype stigma TaxID=117547 RepID=A0AAN9YSM4_9PEZI
MSSRRPPPRGSEPTGQWVPRKDKNQQQPAWMREMSELLLQPGAGQLVHKGNLEQTTTTTSGLIRKVSFKDRVDPCILPTDKVFLEVEKYFQMLLRSTRLSIDQILEATFEQHEISLLVPTSGPPDVVRWQKENTIRYQALLRTVFKGKQPTVQLKMAMLYFGLPVAPLKMGRDQSVKPIDLDFLEDEVFLDRPALDFLDMYPKRCYGDATRRTKSKEFFKLVPTQKFTSTSIPPSQMASLRGGSLESLDSDSLSDEERSDEDYLGMVAVVETDNDEEVADVDTSRARTGYAPFIVCGYQGLRLCDNSYPGFVNAVDQLLSFSSASDYDITLHFFALGADGVSIKEEPPVESITGKISHGPFPPPGCPITAAIIKYFNNEHDPSPPFQPFALFVHYPHEASPEVAEPSTSARDVLKLYDENTTEARQPVAYVRKPFGTDINCQAHQFWNGYRNAMSVLFQGSPYNHWTFSIRTPGVLFNIDGSSYGRLDPPTEVWDQVVKYCSSQEASRSFQVPSVHLQKVFTNEFAEHHDEIPILVADFHNHTFGLQPRRNLILPAHFQDTSKDAESLQLFFNAAYESNPYLKGYKELAGLDIWFPSEDIFIRNSRPTRISSCSKQGPIDWRKYAEVLVSKGAPMGPAGASFIVRPGFSAYRVHGPSGKHFEVDLNNIGLMTFVTSVTESLFPEQSRAAPGAKKKVLYLTQTTWKRKSLSAAIRPETSQEEWKWIVRHITEPDITVALEDWDNEWTPSSELYTNNFSRAPKPGLSLSNPWGPRYEIQAAVVPKTERVTSPNVSTPTIKQKQTSPPGTSFSSPGSSMSDIELERIAQQLEQEAKKAAEAVEETAREVALFESILARRLAEHASATAAEEEAAKKQAAQQDSANGNAANDKAAKDKAAKDAAAKDAAAKDAAAKDAATQRALDAWKADKSTQDLLDRLMEIQGTYPSEEAATKAQEIADTVLKDTAFGQQAAKNVRKAVEKGKKAAEQARYAHRDAKDAQDTIDNTKTAAERANWLRNRTYWSTPRIFTDPTKPAMPIHGPPLESVLRTSPYFPGITTAMRTPTEMARLEKEVHTLRNHLLDRTRSCPYMDCQEAPFHVEDAEGLDRHLKEKHQGLKCFLCKGNDALMPYYDEKSIREHFWEYHADELKKLLCPEKECDCEDEEEEEEDEGDKQQKKDKKGKKGKDKKNKDKKAKDKKAKYNRPLLQYCERCGRDQFALDNPDDRQHHSEVCDVVTSVDERTKRSSQIPCCEFCGTTRIRNPQSGDLEPCQCGKEKRDIFDPGDICPCCRLRFDGMTRHYREIHVRLCKPPSGHTAWDFCGYCGLQLRGSGEGAKKEHVHWCERRPAGPPHKCPICEIIQEGPKQMWNHIDEVHGGISAEWCLFCKQSMKYATSTVKYAHLVNHLYGEAYELPEGYEEEVQPPLMTDLEWEEAEEAKRAGEAEMTRRTIEAINSMRRISMNAIKDYKQRVQTKIQQAKKGGSQPTEKERAEMNELHQMVSREERILTMHNTRLDRMMKEEEEKKKREEEKKEEEKRQKEEGKTKNEEKKAEKKAEKSEKKTEAESAGKGKAEGKKIEEKKKAEEKKKGGEKAQKEKAEKEKAEKKKSEEKAKKEKVEKKNAEEKKKAEEKAEKEKAEKKKAEEDKKKSEKKDAKKESEDSEDSEDWEDSEDSWDPETAEYNDEEPDQSMWDNPEELLYKWRPAQPGEKVGPTRASSPDYGGDDANYWPPFEARCSRCFRAAGNDKEYIVKHMDPKGCGIRRGKSNTKDWASLPNHSGWIEYPNDIDFAQAFDSFKLKYPAYRFTMYPTWNDDNQLHDVYYGPYDMEDTFGWNSEDPNCRVGGNMYDRTKCYLLPWPPVAGHVIPVAASGTAGDSKPETTKASSKSKPKTPKKPDARKGGKPPPKKPDAGKGSNPPKKGAGKRSHSANDPENVTAPEATGESPRKKKKQNNGKPAADSDGSDTWTTVTSTSTSPSPKRKRGRPANSTAGPNTKKSPPKKLKTTKAASSTATASSHAGGVDCV